jgi:hypothetical protein
VEYYEDPTDNVILVGGQDNAEVNMRPPRQTLRGLFGIAAMSGLMVGVLVSGAPMAKAATSPPAPVVSSVSPSSGIPGDATLVMISGANFTGATAVTFGSDAAPEFEVDSSTLIRVSSPPGMTGTVDVTVTTPAGTSATSPMDKFTFGPTSSPPVVTSLSPSSVGPTDSVLVTIEGSNFIGTTAVHWGSISIPATQFTVDSSTEIAVGNPTAPVGTVVDVTVTTAAGTSAASSADQFTYTPAPPPGPPTSGYWEVASDGGIFSFGTAPFLGSMGGKHLNAPVVGMAYDQSGGDLGVGGLPPRVGYWEVASDGGIFSFGDAPFYGSMGGIHLNSPIVGMALDAATGGYWEVAADGGVFSFNAPFLGSLGGTHLSSPIVGMAESNNGGYWLATADGAVYAFGAAPALSPSFGSATSPSTPVVGITADPVEDGYWLVTTDGSVLAFGGAEGSTTGGLPLNKPIVGMATYGEDYWEVGADGGIFGTPFYGSMGGVHLNAPVVGMAATPQPLRTGPD